MSFPKGFIWGAASASYQVEGAAFEDGKGLSVWDMFCRKEGAIWNGQSGEVACDHYHRYREDVALMKELGLQAYRLSISWPRVLPHGTGAVNPKGLDFYDRLVDELLAAGIEPWVTLFHWDHPYDLYCRGGWLNPYSSDWFADYTAVVADALSDRVTHWMTHNEPACFIGLGLQDGRHAPGDKLGFGQVLWATHNALLGHGKAVQTLRARARRPLQIGLAYNGPVVVPASDRPADVEAARLAMFTILPTGRHMWNNSWWLDPIFFGRYPADGWQAFGADVPPVKDGDLKTINQPLDFLGVNIYYQDPTIRAGADGRPEPVPFPVGTAQTAFKWNVTPDALYWGPRFLYERYKAPMVITENGLSCMDWVALDGHVHDPQRIDFTQRYLLAYERAGQDGVDIRGYFHWSILDNFEWSEGYKERFGLVYVNYPTQQRIPKDSAYWYKQVIATNGARLHE
ncbi:MAG: GH1 family beta-glucosidase [Chloroflexi bacterium]|nr:GH1 family beta-glucosidase [Chloroflexota bacterium]